MTKQFDPRKQYGWKPEDTFEVTGEQFSLLYNVLSTFMVSPLTPIAFTHLADAHITLRNVLKDTYENKEFVTEQEPPSSKEG